MAGAHPHRRTQSAAGFTLLEVLVVILIIGVIISFAALSIHRADNSVEEETQRLAALIKLGSQEAVLQGREFALEFEVDRYAFVVFDGEQWQPLADDDILRPRTLPFDVVVDLKLEGEQLALATPPPADGMEKRERQVPPRIFLLSSGEMSPFELRVPQPGESLMADHEWSWEVKTSATDDPDVVRLDVSAYADTRRTASLADAVAYLGMPAAPRVVSP